VSSHHPPPFFHVHINLLFTLLSLIIISYYLIRYICWYITVAFMLFPHKLNKCYLRLHNPTHFAVIQCRTPLLSYLHAMHHGKSLQMFGRKWRHESVLTSRYFYVKSVSWTCRKGINSEVKNTRVQSCLCWAPFSNTYKESQISISTHSNRNPIALR